MKELLFLSMVRWDTIWQRPQHLAIELSKYFRIFYVDPVAYSFYGAVRNHLRGDRTRNFRPKLREINNNLVVYTPLPMIPFSEDYWFINEFDHRILWASLSKLLNKYDYHDPVLYLNSPYQLPILNHFPHSFGCYDCMDHYEAFYKPESRRKRVIKQKEEELLSQIQVILATSEKLVQLISVRNKNVNLVQNGVTELFLNYGKSPNSTPPSDFPPGIGPVIGYIGAISHWFDQDSLRILATKHPGWRFIFIGPILENVDALLNIPNVFFLRKKEYELLPSYVDFFDIAIIPFLVNDLTKFVNPVKLYEYFALGKPVVATRLPELNQFEESIYLADTSQEFVEKVEDAIKEIQTTTIEFRQNQVQLRKNIAATNTWKQRAAQIYSILSV